MYFCVQKAGHVGTLPSLDAHWAYPVIGGVTFKAQRPFMPQRQFDKVAIAKRGENASWEAELALALLHKEESGH